MSTALTFRELTETMRPQDPHGDGTGLRFETGEHGGEYPPQAITVTDAQGRWGRVRSAASRWQDRRARNAGS
jgi:hypothetical protein